MNSNIPSVGSQTQSKRNAFCFGQRLTSKRSLFITCSKEMMFERNDVWKNKNSIKCQENGNNEKMFERASIKCLNEINYKM